MENLRIYISTWNVATNSPSVDLNGLLDFPSITNAHRPLPDFYILGFQEVNSQPQNIVKDSLFDDPWTASLTKILTKNEYVLVKKIRLQGLLLVVFTLRPHLLHLRDVETQYTKTGFGGMWGNKGAVSIRLTIYGCSICFINTHLTPHDHNLDERIADYNNIIKSHTYHVKDTANILFHDYVFWLGDLNFRLSEDASDSSLAISERVKRVEKDDFSDLLKFDQLRTVMEKDLAFSELKETAPRFPPTYKFIIGSSEYDLKRRPSWTDRILYKVNPNNYENITLNATQLNYFCLPQYTISDHKPVISEFTIKIRGSHKTAPKLTRGFSTYSQRDGIEEEQVIFSNYTERCIEFSPIKEPWYIGDADLVIKFSLSGDVHINSSDWIGVYDANFENLDSYITYEYMSKVNTFIPTGDGSSRMVVFTFPVGSGVRTPGFYKFLYFSQPTSEVRSLLGVSGVFEVRSRNTNTTSYSNYSQQHDLQTPSTSSDTSQPSSSQSYEPSRLESFIRDITKIQVSPRRLDMLNDLSID